MKPIDYDRSKGSFTIKYLEDGEIYSGTINIDDKSLKTEKLVKYIIDNEEGSTFTFKANDKSQSENILLVKKDIDIVFEEINENNYFDFLFEDEFLEDEFKNVSQDSRENQLNSDNIYFQFYFLN